MKNVTGGKLYACYYYVNENCDHNQYGDAGTKNTVVCAEGQNEADCYQWWYDTCGSDECCDNVVC